MNIQTFFAYLVSLLGIEMSDCTELLRALKEGSAHFDPDSDAYQDAIRREAAAENSAFLNGEVPPKTFLTGKAGRGGGLSVDPFRATFFLLGLMLDGPRKDAAMNTWLAWHMETAGTQLGGWVADGPPRWVKCPLTGEVLFGQALKAIFSDEDLARRVDKITVGTNRTGEIYFDDGQVSRFEHGPSKPAHLYRVAVIDFEVVAAVANLLARGA